MTEAQKRKKSSDLAGTQSHERDNDRMRGHEKEIRSFPLMQETASASAPASGTPAKKESTGSKLFGMFKRRV